MPRIDIRKPVYTMASVDGKAAEITLYGDIYEQQPRDPWTGRKIEGQFILLDEFLKDLDRIAGCKSLTVHMNSYGGDAGVSNTIHNRLRELSRNGVKTTCIVDGVAMSGGSLIMCGCDTVRANPSSLIMIHKAWTFLFGGYNADEMREAARQNDAWDRMQSEIYQRKTGLSNAVVLHMMADTTYMTGREAREKGFVDELIEDAEPTKIAASADGRTLFVGGRSVHLAPGMFAPDFVPTADGCEPSLQGNGGSLSPLEEVKTAGAEADADETNTISPGNSGNEGGDKTMTMDELRAQQPELVRQIEAAAAQNAVAAEQARQRGIDEVAALMPAELVAAARYGETACDARELAFRAAQRAAKAGTGFLAAMTADARESGAKGVQSAKAPEEGDGKTGGSAEEMLAAGRADAKRLLGKED